MKQAGIFSRVLFLMVVVGATISTSFGRGFLHAEGTDIVDGSGQNYMIRAMGIGGWMVMEPYMLDLNQSADEGQHKILDDIADVIGVDRMEEFHQKWLDNFFIEQDVIALKESGFNTVRIPMHFNLFTPPIDKEPVEGQDTWLDKGFTMIDSLVLWGERHHIYMILDMHAAPGGQGYNGNINDYDPDKPSLWESAENRRKTVALWVKLAERYADNEWVGGYDPLNEPNWAFEGGSRNGCDDQRNEPLREMYAELIPAIRSVDPNHMIVISGNCWGGNHNGLWPMPVADDNVIISFHKYWNENTVGSIAEYTGMRDQYHTPLWMSESGENTDKWFYDAVELLEEHTIGWAWWTWKKLNAGMHKITIPDGYQELLDYWDYTTQNPGSTDRQKPDADNAFATLMELAENVRLEHTERNNGSIDALTTGHRSCDTQNPYYPNEEIAAVHYCNKEGGEEVNSGGRSYLAGMKTGNWLAYTLYVPEEKEWTLAIEVSTTSLSTLSFEYYGGGDQLGEFEIPNTEGEVFRITFPVTLPEGARTFGVSIVSSDLDLYGFILLHDDSALSSSSVQSPSSSSVIDTLEYSSVDNISDILSSSVSSSSELVSPPYSEVSQLVGPLLAFNMNNQVEKVVVYGMDGSVVKIVSLSGSEAETFYEVLPSGAYVVKIGSVLTPLLIK
ncbi:MAG: cellulase family glycosylhydrolase [Fibrobacterales bacterium]